MWIRKKRYLMLQVTFEGDTVSTASMARNDWVFYIILDLDIVFAFSNWYSALVDDLYLIELELFFSNFDYKNAYFVNSAFEETLIFLVYLKNDLFLFYLPYNSTHRTKLFLNIVEIVNLCLAILLQYVYPTFFLLEIFHILELKCMYYYFVY